MKAQEEAARGQTPEVSRAEMASGLDAVISDLEQALEKLDGIGLFSMGAEIALGLDRLRDRRGKLQNGANNPM